MDITQPIQARRTVLGLSLAALSERSGVSKAMLSDVERGAKSPTIKTLCQIASGLGCSVSDLLDQSDDQPSELVTARARPSVEDPESGALRQLLSTGMLEHGIEVIQYRLPRGASIGPFPSNGPVVLELITLLRGQVTCSIDDDRVALKSGDSLTYRLSRQLTIDNTGSATAEFILVIDRSRASRPTSTRFSSLKENVAP